MLSRGKFNCNFDCFNLFYHYERHLSVAGFFLPKTAKR